MAWPHEARYAPAMVAKRIMHHATYADLLAAPDEVTTELIDGELLMSPQPKIRHTIAASAIGREIGYRFGRRNATDVPTGVPPTTKDGNARGDVSYRSRPCALRKASRKSSTSFELGSGAPGRELPFPTDDGYPGGWWILHEPEIHLRLDLRVVVPDIAGWKRERMPDPPRDTHKMTIVPDWVCEILSPSTRSFDYVKKMPAYAAAGVRWLWMVEPADRQVVVFRCEAGQWDDVVTVEGSAMARLPPFDAVELDLGQWWEEPGGDAERADDV